MDRRGIVLSTVIILVFLLAFYGNRIFSPVLNLSFSSLEFRIAYFYLWWLIPTAAITGLLFGFAGFFDNLGLSKGLFSGLLFSLVAVSPMFISSAVMGGISGDNNLTTILHKSLIAGFMEEYLFRGFLFGLLFLKLRWGFIPAALLGALIFGMDHLYQGSTFWEATGIFFITAMGAVWFAWLYIEWNNNLWVPIFLHVLMNLSWILFEISNTALGGWFENIFRIMTIALTVIITIHYRKKRGFRINKKNLFFNPGVY